ncbi:MAG: hypothetical protein HY901_16850 [Deltaproteobacteria bacterium]|nr:hypothetical protein [Deltaproteobacteria bacterium]
MRRSRPAVPAPDRKLSEVIKELGLRLLKRPDDAASLPAVQTAILLASAAWNDALGDPALRNRHKEAFKTIDPPWSELTSTDTDQLIAGLVEYKQTQPALDPGADADGSPGGAAGGAGVCPGTSLHPHPIR